MCYTNDICVCDIIGGFADNWGCYDRAGMFYSGLTEEKTNLHNDSQYLNNDKEDNAEMSCLGCFGCIPCLWDGSCGGGGYYFGIGIGRMISVYKKTNWYQSMKETSETYECALRVGGCVRGCLEIIPCSCVLVTPVDILICCCMLPCDYYCPDTRVSISDKTINVKPARN